MARKLLILLSATVASFAFSAIPASAQTNPAEKVIQGVMDTVEALIGAKDKNEGEGEARLDAYKKVLELATTDARDMRLKLLAYEDDKTTTTTAVWKKNRIAALQDAVKHYENETRIVNMIEHPTVDEVKLRAEDLKKWREETYTPLFDEVQSYLLLEQHKKSLETAENRLEKVSADVAKLKKAKFKKIKEVEESLKKASTLIGDARAMNDTGVRQFAKSYLYPFMKDGSEEKLAIEAELKEDKMKAEKEKKELASSSSTPPTPPMQSPSIKETVDASFTKVKESYQIFIEMSNLVRRSL
jgi:hypothetical protein